MKNKSIHIKFLYFFYYIVALFMFLAGLIYLFAPGYLKTAFPENPTLLSMSNGSIRLWGALLIVFAFLEGLLGFKLSRLSRIAKIIAITISILGFVWALLAIIVYQGMENLFFLAIHGYFIWVLIVKYKNE